MEHFTLTAFAKTGETLLNETFEAKDEEEAKRIGQSRLEEEGYADHTSRVTNAKGKLVLFHR